MYRNPAITAAFICFGLLAILPVRASQDMPRKAVHNHEQARSALEAGEIVSLRDVVTTCENDFSGRMVQAELARDLQGWAYNLKMLTPGGSILKVQYDAFTRKLVSASGYDLARWYRGDPSILVNVASPGSIRSRIRKREYRPSAAPLRSARTPPWHHRLLEWLGPEEDERPAPSPLEPDPGPAPLSPGNTR